NIISIIISLAVSPKSSAIKAAILIQRWYRSYMARLEMRRRYSLTIFQSIEYADEQAQMQVCILHFFATNKISSHFFSSSSDYAISIPDHAMKEYERIIEVPASYRGPHLCFPLTVADTEQLHARYVLQLFHETRKVLQQMPNITHLSTSYAKEVTICGDLHGKLDDLLLIFYKNGLPSEENPYVFNGDFVDRGKNSMEILIILFAFLLVYPNHLHLNRGNHEDHLMNLSWLPLATIIDNQVLILHGGISDTTDLNFLNSFHRNKLKSLLRPVKSNMEAIYQQQRTNLVKTSINLTETKKCNSRQDISKKNVMKSTSASCERRQYAKEVGDVKGNLDGTHDITSSSSFQNVQCLKPYNLTTTNASPELTAKEREQICCMKLLIRSHQCKQEGYEISHNGKVITIFSASNYYEEGSNRGAYIKLNPDVIPHFVQYQVSKSTRKQTLHQRVTTIELSALKGLREKLYTHKSDLITAFTQYDPLGTVCLAPDGSVEYLSCFDNLEIILPIKEFLLCLGLISADEFRQTWKLFNAHVKNDVSDESIDSLARTMDFNKDGSIDFNEFLEAFRIVHKFSYNDQPS
ncbi:hypothetical protein E2320_004578, partial [Naja naja]